MKVRTAVGALVLHYITVLVTCDRKVTVGHVESAPKYGSYPYKTSNDIFMDPCKACKFVIFNKFNYGFLFIIQFLHNYLL